MTPLDQEILTSLIEPPDLARFTGEDLYGTSIHHSEYQTDCKVIHICNETGSGMVSAYKVFQGIELFYNDMHLAYCSQEQTLSRNIIEINHCRQGRFECDFGNNSCVYIKDGDFSIGSLMHKRSCSSFPLRHYHGITIVIDMAKMQPELQTIMQLLGIELREIQHRICEENHHYIMRANESIAHIFSELYHVRQKQRMGYMKIKVLELLLFLSDPDTHKEMLPIDYYSKRQVKLAKTAEQFITEDLTVHYTIEQLANKLNVSASTLKKCFRGVYGTSIYAYLKYYRLQNVKRLLQETRLSITEIALMVGYENPNKLSAAFKKTYGMTPSDFRKGIQTDSSVSVWSGEKF